MWKDYYFTNLVFKNTNVIVKRSSGSLENDWKVNDCNLCYMEKDISISVVNYEKDITKQVHLKEFYKLNPTISLVINDFPCEEYKSSFVVGCLEPHYKLFLNSLREAEEIRKA